MKEKILKFKTILMVLFAFTYLPVQAQVEIKGKVTSDMEDEALPGVNIVEAGTTNGTITDIDGNYVLNVSEDATLVFSYIGYVTEEVPLNGRSTIDMSLVMDLKSLQEVVVIGYGTQEKRDVTGAIGSIEAEEIESFPTGSINSSIQGKIAGVQITSNSGEPGAGMSVRIRGASSVNGGNQPLYIIDGVPLSSDSYSAVGAGGSSFSPLADINPSNIASIEVLKDAGSASIYGSRASNGVVIITTKSGKGISKPEITLSLNSSYNELSRSIGVLNGPQFRSAYQEAVFNRDGEFTDQKSVVDSVHPYYSKSVDWQKFMFQPSFQYKADLGVRGGSENINYNVSLGYRDLDPIVRETEYKQITGAAKIGYNISDFITGTTNINFSKTNYTRIINGFNGVIGRNLRTFPMYAPYDVFTGEIVRFYDGTKLSPLAEATYRDNQIARTRVIGRQELVFHLMEGLDFTTSLSFDYENMEAIDIEPPILQFVGSGAAPSSELRTDNDNSFVQENVFSYNKSFQEIHNFSVILGQSYQKRNYNTVSIDGEGFIDNQNTRIGSATTILGWDQELSERALFSLFGRINYDYKGKYLASFTLRRDGSSRFGSTNRYGTFPAVSAGWRFSDEAFFSGINFINDGKIRGSFGITGNRNIGNYAWRGGYNAVGGTTYLGNLPITASGLPNSALKWETTTQYNLGMDLSMFNYRVNINMDVYRKESEDLLFNVEIPNQTGYGSVPLNFGSIRNEGFELALSTTNIVAPFTWETSFTVGINENTVTALPGGDDYRPNNYNLARVGAPLGIFYGLKALGVYSTSEDNVYKVDEETGEVIPYRRGTSTGYVYQGGDMIWDDANGDGVINDDDLQVIGNPNPDVIGGFNNTISYKAFTLNAFLTYSFGNDVFNNLKRQVDGSEFATNYTTDQLRRWREPGDITDVPKLTYGDPIDNYAISSRFVEDASYIRLRTLSIGYELPKNILERFKIKSMNITLSGVNLLTWSNYTGYDPEVSGSSASLEAGVDGGSFPRQRSYNLSLNVKF